MKQIKLTQGKFALVDDEDFDFLNQWKWSVSKIGNNFYAMRSKKITKTRKSITIRMHRLILNVSKGEYVDHIDMNGLNNQRSNIRVCTNAENSRNRTASKNTSSKFKGVSWHKRNKKWCANIKVDRKTYSIGSFTSEIEAAKAYDLKAKELHGEFANFNFK